MADLGDQAGDGSCWRRYDDEALAALMTNLGGHDSRRCSTPSTRSTDDRPDRLHRLHHQGLRPAVRRATRTTTPA